MAGRGVPGLAGMHPRAGGRRGGGKPRGTDIVVSHGPPLGFGDLAPRPAGGEHVGSPSLRNRLLAVRPRLCVFGHIHEGRGVYRQDGTVFANASLVDHRYDMVYTPMVFEIEAK